jgi:hypothetical protein
MLKVLAGLHAWLAVIAILGCTEVRNERPDLSTDSGEDPAADSLQDDPTLDPSGDCPSPLVECDSLCVDIQSNHEHCGACSRACEPAQVCSGGECMLECPAGTGLCSGGCVVSFF